MNNTFEKEFALRYFEMNKQGTITPSSMLTLLEETAADHCEIIDHSLYQLGNKNMGWVLVSGCLEMYRYPKYKENIIIKTWMSEYSSVKGIRENIIYDERRNVIGKAKGLWIFFDISRRRPIRIFEEIKTKWSSFEEVSIACDLGKVIPEIESGDIKTKIKVQRYDTDMNEHVNNIRYLDWLMDSIPKNYIENYALTAIDGRFLGEARLKDRLINYTRKGSEENSFLHTIKNIDTNKVCATAITHWSPIN
ncbi:acyl-[acyl-carrier-protein] thioesterase [Namhaeicola litoreus]|uniref:Acyl-[acyl-carrier-protein] thioesterase n=1 Tax=Namhaeicola litoreus TaxID=1052145 RepID=A0ABW3Y2K0_9FLAO